MNLLLRSCFLGIWFSLSAFGAAEPTAVPSSAVGPKILFLGDSLTEGYGVSRERSFPAKAIERLNDKFVQRRLAKRVDGLYAGVSGSTTASGPSRLKWFLKAKPDVLFLALGANDGLRGVPAAETEKNLDATMKIAQEAGMKIVLAGMKLPPNYGKKSGGEFEVVFAKLAKKYDAILMPFLLEGVAGEKTLNQEDGIHPNEKGHAKMAEAVVPYLEKALGVAGAK
jgi:acyl-CoA thioesterase-1